MSTQSNNHVVPNAPQPKKASDSSSWKKWHKPDLLLRGLLVKKGGK